LVKTLDRSGFRRQTGDMEDKSQAEKKAAQRRERLAAALRENLKRRKQARREKKPAPDKQTGH